MKKIIFLILPAFIYSYDPSGILDEYVYNYLLLTESKVESSPIVWQDVKEGYLRNYILRFTNSILDSLDSGKISSYNAGLRHLFKIDSLCLEIRKGGEYKHTIMKQDIKNYHINYFYSSFK